MLKGMSSPYAPVFGAFEGVIQAWAKRHGLEVVRVFLGKEIRGATLTDRFGNDYNVQVLPPTADGIPVRAFSDGHRILFHAGQLRKQQLAATEFAQISSFTGLDETLEAAYAHVQHVMETVDGPLR